MESPIDLRNLQDYYTDPSVCLKEDTVAFQNIDTTKFRRGICAIITNGTQILLLERTRSSRWQFVQGGIEDEDTSLVTLHKEIWEEIGLESKDYTPIAKLPTALSYALPPDALKDPRYASRNYMGQAHIYYLVEWKGDISTLNFSHAEEFTSARWADWTLNSIVPNLPRMKLDAYGRALIYFKDYLDEC